MKRIFIVMLFSSLVFSCKKENDKAPGCPITMDNLSGAYKLTALQYKVSASATAVDYLAFMDDCEKDDILNLKADGIYRSDDAGTVCTPENTSEGSWQVKGKTLTSDGTLNGTIASFDCKTLVYYVDNAIQAGDRLTFTLEKQ